MFSYEYEKQVNVATLEAEIRANSSILIALDNITALGDIVTIVFRAELSSEEQTVLDSIVTEHVYSPDPTSPMVVEIAQQKDSEGSLIVRSKQAPTGWNYHAHAFEFKLSTLNSDVCLDENGDDFGFTSIKLYNAAGEEITDQPTADTDCVKTVLDWEPTHDFEILSGKLYFKDETLNEDIRLWVIGVPDIPKEYGGSRCFANGINLDYLDAFQPIETDGRVSKYMSYNPTLHSNKFRFILRHNPGKKLDIMFVLEIYKA